MGIAWMGMKYYGRTNMKNVNEICTEDGCNNSIDNPSSYAKYCEQCRPAIRKRQMMDAYHRREEEKKRGRGKNIQKKPINQYWLVRGIPSTHGGKLFG